MEKAEQTLRTRLLHITALASEYCNAVQNAISSEQNDFVIEMTSLLPRLYWEFGDLSPESVPSETVSLEEEEEDEYYGTYVDEDFYDSIRRGVETLLGPDDTYLETFEEDMKYSDTPIAASISEGLADIFQALFNFISIVKDTDGDSLEGSYRQCHEAFADYWSQTACNVLRALNNIRYKNQPST